MRIVAVGECMVELREQPGQGLAYAFAGDTLNVATYLRRLLPRASHQVDYLTALGDDPLSERMLQAWQAEGIGTALVRRLPGELPGLYWIHKGPDGDREFFYWRSAAAARQVFDDGFAALDAVLQRGDLLYLSAISLAILPGQQRDGLIRQICRWRAGGVRVVYDSNYRPRLWDGPAQAQTAHHAMLDSTDLFFTTFPDESALFGDTTIDDTVARLKRHGVPEWVVRGDPGTTVTSESGPASLAPVDAIEVVDTTGAGDSFDAAYISARLVGADGAAAVRAGHALAAVVVAGRGAIIEASSTPSLEALLPA